MRTAKTILIDCDGVLTDGTLTIDHTGAKLFKSFHTRDVRAIRELIYNGWEVVIVTADDWPGINHFAAKVGADVQVVRDKSAIQIPNGLVAAVGDDAWDFAMLKQAHMGFAPADADQSLASLERLTVLTTKGGRGCVAEVVRVLARRGVL